MCEGFTECPQCAAKPGQPSLCESCLRNRSVILRLERQLEEAREEAAANMHALNTVRNMASAAISAMLREA
jgi:hypothetical protein